MEIYGDYRDPSHHGHIGVIQGLYKDDIGYRDSTLIENQMETEMGTGIQIQ